VEQGTSPGYVYRRLEDAHYARKTIIDRASCEQEMPGDLYPLAALCVCDTLEHFLCELVERGVLVDQPAPVANGFAAASWCLDRPLSLTARGFL